MQDGRSERLTQAIAQSLRWLRQRDHSTYELAQRLTAKGFTDAETRETIDWLTAEGYLSDARLAERLTERYTEEQPSGRLRIEQEFARRGLHAPALAGDEESRAVRALHLRFGEPPAEADPRLIARWFRFLLQRGFEPEIAHAALRRWNPRLNDEP
ncbi:MAG: RecX family transcriptional regulator [Fimbriimonadales bacterium]|nr:RecX family transcriptional regulator [Fimbriimonadales bacterium]